MSIQWFSFWLQLLSVASVLSAELPPPIPASGEVAVVRSGPWIQLSEPIYNFGRAPGGEAIKHDFVFTNTGDKTLEIKDIKTTCGCVTSGKWSRQVEPGKTGVIPIELVTGGLSGNVAKPIRIVCNMTNPLPPTLQITGTVWWPIQIFPSSANFSILSDASATASSTVRITNNESESLVLSEPVSSSPRIAAELISIREGQEFQLKVKLVPPLGAGNVFGQITLKTSSKKMPVLHVPVYAVLQATVIALPSTLTLPPNLTTNDRKQTVSIRSFWTNALVLSDVSLNAQGASVELKELQPGHFFTFTVNFPEGFQIPSGEKIELKMRTNHPQYPTIQVPILQKPRSVPATSALPQKTAINSAPLPPGATPH